jgi:MFS family permease
MASLLPLYLQGAQGHAPLAAGIAMLPFALAMLLFPRVGRWLGTHGNGYQVLTLGLLLVGFGNALMVHAAWHGGHVALVAAMAILGAGGGLLNGETQKAVMVNVPPQRAGMASGISTTSRFAGILLGFSGLGALLASGTRAALASDPRLRGLLLSNELIDRIVAGDVDLRPSVIPMGDWPTFLQQVRQDYGHAFADVFLLAALIAGTAANIVFWTMRRRRADGQR